MALAPHPGISERILVMGGWGQGKTYDWLSIARLAKQTGSEAKFYVLDTDNAVGHMLAMEFEGLAVESGGNVVLYPCFDWRMLTKALDEILTKMRPADWLVVDLISPTWDWVQEFFTEEVFAKDLDQYFLEARKANKQSGGGFEGWKDWPVINGLYKSFQNKLLRVPGHLYATASVDIINNETVDKDIKIAFGPHGVKPKGQKHTPHFFHTVLWKNSARQGEWRIITIKDRGREMLAGQPVANFAVTYLKNVAGWTL